LSSVLVRILGRTDSTQSMMFWMTSMLSAGATAIALPDWQPIQRDHYWIILGVALTGAIGQWGVTEAFRRAPAATVAPLEYSGLAWVMVIDFFVWSAIPALSTLVGAAVIIGSGLYLLRFESKRVS
jgi:drug/metabolite transporter (DMT)-like permease